MNIMIFDPFYNIKPRSVAGFFVCPGLGRFFI